MKLVRNIALLLLISPAAAMAVVGTPTPQYTITDLGVTSGQTYSQTWGASSNGQYAVGRNLRAEGEAGDWPTFVWNASTGTVAQAALPDHVYGWGYAVNNSGVAVGVQAAGPTGNGALPTMWVNGTATQLKMPTGQTVGRAYDINNAGVAVGSVGSDVNEVAVIYNTVTGKTTQISALTGDGSYMSTALGISDTGIVVGAGVDASSRNVALVYNSNNGTMTTLQVPAYSGGYNNSLALTISDNGLYIGGTSGNSTQAFIWSAATGALLAPLPAISSNGGIEAITDAGWAVGSSGGVYSNPFLYENGQTYLVSDIIANPSGWNFSTTTSASAVAISNDGTKIFGTAQYNGIEHSYMLTAVGAVPEPASYALMLGGLLAVASVARRRKA